MSGTTPETFYRRLRKAIGTGGAAPAYRYFDERRTYDDLFDAMRAVNAVLDGRRRQGIALHTGKGLAAYAAVFAVLISDNVWIPISPDQPAARIIHMLELSRARVVLTDRPLAKAAAAYAADNAIAVLSLDEILAAGTRADFEPRGFARDDVAYIMFTSGSTGTPKGVPMTHENYINFVDNALAILPLRQGDVFADYHDFGFDLSVFYLFCCVLVQGAFAPGIEDRDRLVPLRHLRENEVTVLASVPGLIARVRALRREGEVRVPVRILFLCGEPFRLDILDYCQRNLAVERIYNFYGLTETGIENFHHECQPGDVERYSPMGFVPIGRPLKGSDIRLTDDEELLLSGCQITPGYLGGIGVERFETIDDVRWFHSGDKVVPWDGVYFCKGRLDSQVKVGGYRIELMEIETHLRRVDGIDEAVCFVVADGEREFIVAGLHGQECPVLDQVRDALADTLPSYMIPRRVFHLDAVPLNKSGKIDRLRVRRVYEDGKGAHHV